MGAGGARWLRSTGEPIHAADVLRWGFVERVVDAARLDAEVDQGPDTILAGGAQATLAQKCLNPRLRGACPSTGRWRLRIEEFERASATGETQRLMRDYLELRRK